MRPSAVSWPVRRHRHDAPVAITDDALAAEEPLEIRLNGRSLVVTMRTPGHDEDLAIGFLHDEGILHRDAEPRFATIHNPLDAAHDNIVDVRVEPAAIARLPAARSFHASSACGVCGQASLDDMARSFPPIGGDLRIPRADLLRFADLMREAQPLFERTGGLHAAALFIDGALMCLREDVGRHNAVDKVVGWSYRAHHLPLANAALVVSGRAGYEVVQKAVAAGIPIVAAVGAPSSLAASLARQSGLTLVGFLRDGGFNIYTGPERIV